ncbi:hypothetical protein EI94DRAFT_1710852, partial [Lactarius quietus]
MAPRPTPPLPPLLLPVPVVVELDQIAETLANAFLNCASCFGSQLLWQPVALAASCFGSQLLWQPVVSAACCFGSWLWQLALAACCFGSWLWQLVALAAGCFGNWLLWQLQLTFVSAVKIGLDAVRYSQYAPKVNHQKESKGILTEARQGQMLAVTQKLQQLLQASLNTKSWRGSELPTGVENFSAAWHEQGHELPSAAEQYLNEIPRASANFRNPDSIHCLKSILESNSILSANLNIIHLALYSA